MKNLPYFLVISYLIFSFSNVHSQQLVVYDNIPGRNASDQYVCKVKFASEENSAFRDAFVLQTICKTDAGYYENLYGWSASWIAFESDFNGDSIVVEISKKDGSDITKAMVRPVGDASASVISNGKAYVTFTAAANVNVDINGQMEDVYTGMEYSGDPIHTISIFANPVFTAPAGGNVITVQPTDDLNAISRDSWDAVIFAPGVHDVGRGFQILDNEVLYIPGDAVVHGTIHPLQEWGSASSENFKVFGSGAISGENYVWTGDGEYLNKTFTYQSADAILEGFVVIDPANHTFNMNCSYDDPLHFNTYKNLKIFGWRANSDAINAFRHSVITDCFFRVQDDVFYYGENVKISNNTTWNDANGSVLFLTKGSTLMEDSYFKDITSIYHRSFWHYWTAGRIISMRETPPGRTIENVSIQNILVEDPFPAFPPFYATMVDGEGDITLNNIVIENVHQEYDGVSRNQDQTRGKPQNTMLGLDNNRKWENITFKDCYFNGKILTSFEDGNFLINDYVDTNTVIFQIDNGIYPPIANFSADNTSILTGGTVNFTDLSSYQPTSWSWTFQGGTPESSTEQNPTVTFTTAGTYDVELNATNANGTDVKTKIGYITVTDELLVDAITDIVAPDQVTPGETITVSVTYEASDNRDLVVFIQQNASPWIMYGSTTEIVTAGTGTKNVNLLIDPNIPIATDAYKIVANLRDVGGSWPGYDEKIMTNVDAVSNATSMHVVDIATGTKDAGKGRKNGTATITIHDEFGENVSGATVTATFSGTFNETVSGVTVVDGTVTLITNAAARSLVTVNICVDDVSHNTLSYDSQSNNITCTAQLKSAGSINKNNANEEIRVYPTPVSNMLYIENADDAEIKIFNANGQIIYKAKSDKSTYEVNVNELKVDGFIIIQAISGQSVSTHKVLIVK